LVGPPLPTCVLHKVGRLVSEDEVEAFVLQFVAVKAAFVVPPDVSMDAAHRKVHLAKAPGRVIALLTIYRKLADAATMCFEETLGLHQQAARAATVQPRMASTASFTPAILPSVLKARKGDCP
jgi:hypothetical protein